MIADHLNFRLARLIAVLFAFELGLVSLAHASSSIVYKLVVFVDPRETNSQPISGTFAGTPFGGSGHDVVMTFTFHGDTANVIPFTQPVTGAENLLGTASVQINSASTGALVRKGTFLPAAGIYVSVDNTNGGLGFGSFGALPSSPQFPGNVAYPYSANFIFGLTSSYDLIQYGYIPLYNNISCVGFPFLACAAGAPLMTTEGDLIVNPVFGDGFALFFAEPQAFSFASFNAPTRWTTSGVLNMSGRFTLGRDSNGINPLTEAVTLKLIDSGGASRPDLTIPAGSFQLESSGRYSFQGTIAGVALNAQIQRIEEEEEEANRYEFQFSGSGAPLADPYAGVPIAVTLIIGDDLGTTTATKPIVEH